MQTKTRRRAIARGLLLVCWGLGAPSAGADPVIDQEIGEPDNGNRIIGDERDVAQTLTVGTGGVLTRVDLKISLPTTAPVPEQLWVEIRPTTLAGLPTEDDTAVLDRIVVDAEIFPTFLEPIDFTAIEGFGVAVAPGDEIAVVLRTPTADGVAPYDWRAALADYGGGTAACRGAEIPLCASGWAAIQGDQQLRTWVDPALRVDASVGEPAIGTHFVGDETEWAQTFTVETTGTLRRIDLGVRRSTIWDYPNDLVVDVRPTALGVPVEDDGAALVTRSLESSRIPAYGDPRTSTRIDDLEIPVTAGEVLALVLRSAALNPIAHTYDWFVGPSGGDLYAGGSAFCRGTCAPTWAANEPDQLFRAIVEAPEPDAAVLGAVACAALYAGVVGRSRNSV